MFNEMIIPLLQAFYRRGGGIRLRARGKIEKRMTVHPVKPTQVLYTGQKPHVQNVVQPVNPGTNNKFIGIWK